MEETKHLEHYRERIARAREALEGAETVVVGGGAGLSAAAGLDYGEGRFRTYFDDFYRKYGISDLYSAMFYPFETPEELWAHHARHVLLNRFEPGALPLYTDLFRLCAHKDWFVITTNVDSQFEKAGFERDKIFEVQGNYGFLQCARGCHDGLYDDEKTVREMVRQTRDCKISSRLVPACPVCGGPMALHVRTDDSFVQDARFFAQRERFDRFLGRARGGRVVFLELGVGFNTPGIIRFPFEKTTRPNPRAVLIRLNRDFPQGFAETEKQTVAFDEEMCEVIKTLW